MASVEIFTGMSFLAVYTGLIFARFSRPTARFLFAENAVIGQEAGAQHLMIRIANERQNTISGATARLWFLRNETNPDGSERRRFTELHLARSDNPVFVLSWTLFHEINQKSALYGATPESMAQQEAAIILTLTGVDDSSGMTLHARHTYSASSIKWYHRYTDIFERSSDGEIVLDYGKMHSTKAEK